MLNTTNPQNPATAGAGVIPHSPEVPKKRKKIEIPIKALGREEEKRLSAPESLPAMEAPETVESDRQLASPEKSLSEESSNSPEIAGTGQAATAFQTIVPPLATPPEVKDVENILAAGLENIYLTLPEAERREFKAAGETTALKINDLLKEVKVKMSKLIDLIKRWLSLLPGVNKFFIEQEAKIRADKLLKLRGERGHQIEKPEIWK